MLFWHKVWLVAAREVGGYAAQCCRVSPWGITEVGDPLVADTMTELRKMMPAGLEQLDLRKFPRALTDHVLAVLR